MAFAVVGNDIIDTTSGKKVGNADRHNQAVAEARKRVEKGEGRNERLEIKRGRKKPPPPTEEISATATPKVKE